MTQTSLSRRAVLAASTFALPGLALAQSVTPPLGPFRFKAGSGEETDAERGALMVPEDRRDPASRQIRLTYVRFPSRAARPGPPIVYLAGGPGGTATRAAAGPRFPIFMALREVADVIAFDQRGTGAASAIPPAAPREGPLPVLTREGYVADQRAAMARAWRDWTAAGVAMRGYNTAENADDVEALRRHLGPETLNLWGISYGSHLALSILRRHGERIGRVALASLEGQDQTVKRPARLDAYLARVNALLDADPAARAAVPDLPALMRRVHARLEANPVPLQVSRQGKPTELRVGGFAVQILAGGLIANPNTLVLIPGLYLALDAGDASVLAPFFQDPDRMLTVSGMPEAMDLASGISRARLAQVRREAKTAVLGDALNFPMPHLLGVVPGVDLGPGFRAPMRIDHPALLVAGTLDGRTPLEEQAEVAAQFRRKARVIVENAGHNVFESHPEVQTLIVRFFAGGEVGDTRLSLPPPKFRID